MKLSLFVSDMSAGGAERVAATLATAWARRGWDVRIVSTYAEARGSYYKLPETVRCTSVSDVHHRIGVPSRTLRKCAAIRTLLSGGSRPDVVVSLLTNVNVTVLAATRGLRIPVVVSERVDPSAAVEFSPWLRLARRVLYPSASALVVQTPAAIPRFKAIVGDRLPTFAVPNPLPPGLPPARDIAVERTRPCKILGVGRLTSQKRFDLLIRAFSAAFPVAGSAYLVILGEGPERDALTSLVRDLRLMDRVRMPGTTGDVWNEMAEADVFALTSAYEGFPNAMLEAMALGVPCVAFDCPTGPRDLSLDGKVARLVPQGDLAEFASRLRGLADDPKERMLLGKAGAAAVRTMCDPARVLAMWDDVFDRVLRLERRR